MPSKIRPLAAGPHRFDTHHDPVGGDDEVVYYQKTIEKIISQDVE